jgi:hypothetical protein
MDRNSLVLMLLFLFCMIGVAHASDWRQTNQFVGSSTKAYWTQTYTDYFNVTHDDWKIIWSFQLSEADPLSTTFAVYVYDQQGALLGRGSGVGNGGDQAGTINISDEPGTYHVIIYIFNCQLYIVTVMEDVDSVLEFSSSSMLLALLLIGALFVCMKPKRGKLRIIK